MSGSESSSDESEPRESLVAGRAKRSTAGNRLSHLLKHLDDDDVKADLLAEDEDDQADYSASGDDQDADAGMDSSSEDDEDGEARDPADAADQDLAGEKELKRQERHDSSKKRRARDLVRIQPMQKRSRTTHPSVALSGDQKRPTAKIQKTVLERAATFRGSDFGPVRQSSRTQTIANAEVTKAKLEDQYHRAVQTQQIMKLAAEKKAASAAPVLTQADRMARALEIEQENSQSLDRWETFEKERLRLQRERLESMRNRTIPGPFIRYWSGPVMWRWRQGPDGPLHEAMSYKIADKPKIEIIDSPKTLPEEAADDLDSANVSATVVSSIDLLNPPTAHPTSEDAIENPQAMSGVMALHPDTSTVSPSPLNDTDPIVLPSQGKTDAPHIEASAPLTLKMNPEASPQTDSSHTLLPSMPPYIHLPDHLRELTTPRRSLASHLPLHHEKAARALVILEAFDELEAAPAPAQTGSSRRAQANGSTAQLTAVILPDSQADSLTTEQRKYLTGKMRQPPKTRESIGVRAYTRSKDDTSDSLLPPAPAKSICAITGQIARFRDPRTGLHYRDRRAYVAIQRILSGGSQWSTLLGSWSGIVGSGPLSRVALGVPDGFWSGVLADEDVKMEG